MVCRGEYVIQAGELGMEMYFILEGTADVISATGETLANLYKGYQFGEIALLPSQPTVRNAHVVATTNMSLAVLDYD
jgi:CRP-like cAMP-binding protein